MRTTAPFLIKDSIDDSGNWGSVGAGPDNKVVGLYWASGAVADGDPLRFGLACTATRIEMDLGVVF